MWWAFLAVAVIGYLMGSLPTGLIVGRLVRGVDIREYGSGKTGFTNVLRTAGLRAGAAVLVVDIAKGALPVVIGRVISDEPYVLVTGALAAVAGHDWPIYAGFRGGRGVATSFGGLLAMSPIVALVLLPVGLALVGVTRIMSVMSVGMAPVSAGVFVGLAIAGVQPWAYAVYALLAGALLVVLHRENARRLLAGTEPRLGRGGERRIGASAPAEGEGGGPGAR
jgi:glycerol-3-phosphate acyltransferase PlsY